VAQFISIIGMSFFLPFIPLYLKELGLQSESDIATWSGLLFSAGFLMLSIAAPFWGVLADRWGRKIMVIRAMAGGAIVLYLSSLVQTPSQLLILRLIHGCLGGFVSSAIALIASETPKNSLGMSLGLFQSAITGGFIVGPFMGGVLQDYFGIRSAILIGAGCVLAGALVVVFFVEEANKPDKTKPAGSLWSNAEFLFQHHTLWPAARIQFLSNLALMSVIPLLALFVTSLSDPFNPKIGTLTGLVISASALSMMMGAPFWGRLSDTWGQKRVLSLCLIVAGLSFIPQGLATSFMFLLISRFFLGFFVAGIAPSLQVLIANHTPAERKAGVLGVSFSITLMGNAIGPLMGGVLGASLGIRMPFFLTAGVLLLAGYLSYQLKIKLVKAPVTSITQAD